MTVIPSLTGRPAAEIAIGESASLRRVCTPNDLIVFAHASGNVNPLHIPGEAEQETGQEAVAPAMWGGTLFSAVLGNRLPGPGTVYLSQTLRFHERIAAGEEVEAKVSVREKRAGGEILLDCRLTRTRDGGLVADGEALVRAPETRLVTDGVILPELALTRGGKFRRLLEACRGAPAMPTAVVSPTDANSLGGAFEAMAEGLIVPLLVGPGAAIRAAAAEIGWDLAGVAIVEADAHAASARAVAMVHEGQAAAIMKGNIHSDELLAQVTKGDGGLRAGRRISHVFVLDVPGQAELLLITDAAINILPDLKTKADIVQNAIDLAHAIGVSQPRVGILSAVETVNPAIPSTLDAAILSKMADRGQIKGGLVDGPLAMDNAVDLDAARTKGIQSSVAGRADVLVAPNLEAGNMLAKQLVFLSAADTGGIVVGARVPVMLTSRADDKEARLHSAALAVLYGHWQRSRSSLVKA